MDEINFSEIFKKAADITWKHKFLWWLGFFVAVSGIVANVSYRGDSLDSSLNESLKAVLLFLNTHAFFFSVLSLAFIYLRITSQAGMIKALQNLELYKNLNTGKILREGTRYFWKLFLAEMFVIAAVIFLLCILVVPILVLFLFEARVLGSFVALGAAAIFFPLAVLFYGLKQYSWLFIVLGDFPLLKSLRMAYSLFKKKPGESLKMILWIFASGLVFVFVVIASLLLVIVPFLLLGFGAKMLLGQTVVLVVLIIGGIIVSASLLWEAALYEIFKQASWVMFFQEISMEKIEKKEETKETVASAIVSPEGI